MSACMRTKLSSPSLSLPITRMYTHSQTHINTHTVFTSSLFLSCCHCVPPPSFSLLSALSYQLLLFKRPSLFSLSCSRLSIIVSSQLLGLRVMNGLLFTVYLIFTHVGFSLCPFLPLRLYHSMLQIMH